MRSSLTLTLTLLAATVSAQPHDTLPITVQADRVTIGAEFVPRFSALPVIRRVPSGATVELDADSSWDYLEVAGTLRVSRTHDTTLRFVHLIVLPGGVLDVGTVADPIPCDRHVEFIVRDVPIDTTRDPFQWGNGLVNFGQQTRVGCRVTPWGEATGRLDQGATTITLAAAPSNWRVGDTLLIPDTAPATPSPRGVVDGITRHETPVTIAAISGAVITLSKGLDFEHAPIVDPQGVVKLRPRVANLTRNIVLRSENPTGTRGHTVDVGMHATWNIRSNQFIALGRTRNVPFDDTSGAHIGTNQRGRYVEHHHHGGSSVNSADVDNTYQGTPTTAKWALALHGTSDTLVQDNVATDFPGAGFVTEDGNEVRNIFRHNLAAYMSGNGENGRDAVAHNCPGCEGNGFWFRGVMNTFDGNEAWNCSRGLNLFNQQQPLPLRYPSVPGGAADTNVGTDFHLKPILMTDNVVAASTVVGYELWSIRKFPNVRMVAANNFDKNIISVQGEGSIDTYLVTPTVICAVGKHEYGVHASQGYTGSFDLEGGQIAGCRVGISEGGGKYGMNITGATLQNEINMDFLPPQGVSTFTNVQHVPLPGFPHQYILFNSRFDFGWSGTGPTPQLGFSPYIPQRGSPYVIKNWQGTGQDFRLFYRQSLGSKPSWPSGPYYDSWNTPVVGLTMQQAWDTYGLSFGGDVLKESDAVELDGIVGGYARAGLAVPYGPPRAIVTFPTMRAPALGPSLDDPALTKSVKIYALLTGDPDAASDVMMASVDGEKPRMIGPGLTPEQGGKLDDRSFQVTGRYAAPGLHTIKVWRTQKNAPGVLLAGSEYTSQYCVGPLTNCGTEPPQPPPPPSSRPTVLAPDVVHRAQSAAIAGITAAGLAIGSVTTVASTSAAVDHVISEEPAAGASVATGSTVNLPVSSGAPPPAGTRFRLCVVDMAGTLSRCVEFTVPGQ